MRFLSDCVCLHSAAPPSILTYKEDNDSGLPKVVVGRNNGVVGLAGFSDKKMSGLLFGPQKSGRNNGVVLLTGWSYGGVPLYR